MIKVTKCIYLKCIWIKGKQIYWIKTIDFVILFKHESEIDVWRKISPSISTIFAFAKTW